MKNIVISCLVAYTFIISNAFSIEENNKKCTGKQLEINYCSSERFKHYDNLLNNLYKKQINYLKNENTEFKANIKYKLDHAMLLRDAQRKWVKFRDSDCLYQTKGWERGSAHNSVHFECMAKLTRERAIHLEQYVLCRENGCPL